MSDERRPLLLGELSWPEAEDLVGATLVVPVGSCEQHGPHLPLDTDTRIAVAIARRASTGLERVAVGPTIAIGASGEHQAFPGTLSIGTEALTAVLVELTRSALPPFGRLVLVNGHGGNVDALRRVVRTGADEGRPVEVWAPRIRGADAHAGWFETSLLLAIDPACVRVDHLAAGGTTPIDELEPRLRADGVRPHSPTGVLGDPTGASVEHGRRLLDELTDELRAVLDPSRRAAPGQTSIR